MSPALQNPFMTMPGRPADPIADIQHLIRCASGVSTAVRTFGPGDILAKLEVDLDSAVSDINAALRMGADGYRIDADMQITPVFLRDPSPEYLSIIGGRQ